MSVYGSSRRSSVSSQTLMLHSSSSTTRPRISWKSVTTTLPFLAQRASKSLTKPARLHFAGSKHGVKSKQKKKRKKRKKSVSSLSAVYLLFFHLYVSILALPNRHVHGPHSVPTFISCLLFAVLTTQSPFFFGKHLLYLLSFHKLCGFIHLISHTYNTHPLYPNQQPFPS